MAILNKKKSVLSKQKLKKGRWYALVRLSRYAVPVVAAVAMVVCFQRMKPIWQSVFAPNPVTWNIDIRASGNEPVTDKARDSITALTKGKLMSGDKGELLAVASAIRSMDLYEDVHVIKIRPGLVSIFVKERSPHYCVLMEKDRMRYVTRTGDIYSYAQGGDGLTACAVVLTGISGLKMSGDELRATLIEGGDLLEVATEFGFKLSTMSFNPYRGFTIWLKDGGTEVAMGRKPFHDKLPKLKDILEKVAGRSEIAVRVELDFHGKAFIKTQKM